MSCGWIRHKLSSTSSRWAMGHCEAVRRKQDVVRRAQSKKQLNQHKFFLLAGGGATGCVVFVSSRNKNKNDKKGNENIGERGKILYPIFIITYRATWYSIILENFGECDWGPARIAKQKEKKNKINNNSSGRRHSIRQNCSYLLRLVRAGFY